MNKKASETEKLKNKIEELHEIIRKLKKDKAQDVYLNKYNLMAKYFLYQDNNFYVVLTGYHLKNNFLFITFQFSSPSRRIFKEYEPSICILYIIPIFSLLDQFDGFST